jgi:deoxyribonuclease V
MAPPRQDQAAPIRAAAMTARPQSQGNCGLHQPRRAAAVVAADATFAQVLAERTARVPEVAPYRPGEFYQRELPPLHAVLDGIAGLGLLVVDGYRPGPGGRPSLGAHTHAEFAIPVIPGPVPAWWVSP